MLRRFALGRTRLGKAAAVILFVLLLSTLIYTNYIATQQTQDALNLSDHIHRLHVVIRASQSREAPTAPREVGLRSSSNMKRIIINTTASTSSSTPSTTTVLTKTTSTTALPKNTSSATKAQNSPARSNTRTLTPADMHTPLTPLHFKTLWKRVEHVTYHDPCNTKFSSAGFANQYAVCSTTSANPPAPLPPAHNTSNTRSSFQCFVNAQTQGTFCHATNLQLNRKKIKVSRGGEEIAAVLGRSEEDEMPEFQPGAFEVSGCQLTENLSPQHVKYSLAKIIPSIARLDENQSLACTAWIEEPVLFVTRYEYANVYHTMTDWYNVWLTLLAAGLLQEHRNITVHGARVTRPLPHRIVFLDGHARSVLDVTWKDLFTPRVQYVSELSLHTCFRNAFFVPTGYTSPIYDWPENCGLVQPAREFANYVLRQHGLLSEPIVANRVTFIFRDPFTAHPRNPGGSVGRQLRNNTLVEAIIARETQGTGLNLHPAWTNFTQQLRAIRSSSILMGVHGAGLTHVLFMAPGSVLVELQPQSHAYFTHFERFARWTGQQYVRVILQGMHATHDIKEEELSTLVRKILDGQVASLPKPVIFSDIDAP